MAPYQYLPLNEDLDEIRTLTLHPGDFSADIHISIQKVVLTTDTPPIYEALSYAWGSTEDPVDIEIGPNEKGTLAITQNLAVTLPYLRYADKVRTLWIDAICINQQDLGERSRQVKRMADIYSLADRVVVWLGPEKDNSAKVSHLMSDLSSEIKVDYETRIVTPASSVSAVHFSDDDSDLPYSSDDALGIDALIRRPWFSRLWIWQEIRLARNNPIVVCGTDTIPWASLRQAIFCLARKRWATIHVPLIPVVALQRRLSIILELCDSSPNCSIGSLIRDTATCKCSDPRDRIYAVQSLPHHGLDRGLKIEPDYTKDTAQVYQDFFLLHAGAGSLEMLRFCELKNDGPTEMPTWVPNWAETDAPKPLWNSGAACAKIEAVTRYQGDRVLRAAGVVFATVSSVLEMTVIKDYHEGFGQILRLAEQIRRLSGCCFECHSVIDAFCRTLCANLFRNRYHPPAASCPSFNDSREAVLEIVRDQKCPSVIAANRRLYFDIVWASCQKRSFIITDEGHIGIAPKATKPGDRVCALLGCEMPLVLRTTSNLHFQVVGECYVDGMMDGEAFLGPVPDNYQPLFFRPDVKGGAYAFMNQQTGNIHYNDPRIGVDERMEQLEQEFKEGKAFIRPNGSVVMEVTPEMLKRRVNVQTFDLI